MRAVLLLCTLLHAGQAQHAVPEHLVKTLRCPFAHVWLKHGAEGAAKVLGVKPHKLSSETLPTGAQPRCTIAPYEIGGAHQHGQSPGYSTNCSGTPAQGSPYMFPMRWKADKDSQSMLVGTNTQVAKMKGVDWYRFDKNWKREDTYGKKNSTMLHRGGPDGARMVFIQWSGDVGANISSCQWMNMSFIGNLRPDFFLDKRPEIGSSIDVQYLGNEHVYYMGEPRLVKKWRKNDMRNTYFVISIDELVGKNGIHFPLMVNTPGEGALPFDQLQTWSNHEVLGEDVEAPFLIDEAHVAAGGSCNAIPAATPGDLPPDIFPSSLDRDNKSWRSIQWTYSPFTPKVII